LAKPCPNTWKSGVKSSSVLCPWKAKPLYFVLLEQEKEKMTPGKTTRKGSCKKKPRTEAFFVVFFWVFSPHWIPTHLDHPARGRVYQDLAAPGRFWVIAIPGFRDKKKFAAL